MTTYSGNLEITKENQKDFLELKEITGYLYISSNVEATLPQLTSVGGNLYINSNVELPQLTSVGGNLSIDSNVELPQLTSVGGNLSINSNVELPQLTSVGGNLYISSTSKIICNFLKNVNYKSIDNYFFVIKNTKEKNGITIYEGFNAKGVSDCKLIEQPLIYVASNDTFHAHGNTIKKVVEDLNYKILQDKIKNEPIGKDDMITVEKYRMITGACELGCKDFMKSNNLKEPMKASELLVILEETNAFGYEKIKQLIN